MARYAAKMQRTASATDAVGSLTAPNPPRRAKLVYFNLGSEGTPANNAFLWRLQRITTIGTGTTVTPTALDPADADAAMNVRENHTVNPTAASGKYLFQAPLNQQATLQWWAPPGGELIVPATQDSGIGFFTPTAGAAVAISAFINFVE